MHPGPQFRTGSQFKVPARRGIGLLLTAGLSRCQSNKNRQSGQCQRESSCLHRLCQAGPAPSVPLRSMSAGASGLRRPRTNLGGVKVKIRHGRCNRAAHTGSMQGALHGLVSAAAALTVSRRQVGSSAGYNSLFGLDSWSGPVNRQAFRGCLFVHKASCRWYRRARDHLPCRPMEERYRLDVLTAVILGIVTGSFAAAIPHIRRHSDGGCFPLGLLFCVSVHIAATAVPRNELVLAERAIASGTPRKRPACQELLEVSGARCRYCGNDQWYERL